MSKPTTPPPPPPPPPVEVVRQGGAALWVVAILALCIGGIVAIVLGWNADPMETYQPEPPTQEEVQETMDELVGTALVPNQAAADALAAGDDTAYCEIIREDFLASVHEDVDVQGLRGEWDC